MKAEQLKRATPTSTTNKQSRNAWLSLALVLGGLLATGLYAAVDSSPGEGDIVFLLLIILAIELHHLRSWPLDRIGQRMQRTKGAVAALIFRGTTRLRELLSSERNDF